MIEKFFFIALILFFLAACEAHYYASFENRSDFTILLSGKFNSDKGEKIAPKTTRYLGWDDRCQKIVVASDIYYLDTSRAPRDALTIGRAGTSSYFKILYDGSEFYYNYSARKRVIIPQIELCRE